MIRNQRGQFLVEGILLMVVFLGIATMVASYFRDKELIKNLVKAPWTSLAGMLQNSEWAAPDAGTINHPSRAGRHVTIEGSKP